MPNFSPYMLPLVAHAFCYNFHVPSVYVDLAAAIKAAEQPAIATRDAPGVNDLYYYRTTDKQSEGPVYMLLQNQVFNSLPLISTAVMVISLLHAKR
jgi:hypothetical protein